jgi:UDP-glucose 4-epimerase
MKLYVTGASGFIGSALVDWFTASGNEAVAVARRPCPVFADNDQRQRITSRLFAADWYDAEDRDAPIVHCAGLSDPRLTFDSLNDIHESEVRPHIGMVESLLSRGWRGRLIFLSSGGTVYGDSDCIPIDEDVPPQPKTPYGLYKLHLEHDFAYLARRSQFKAVSLRVSNPYGGFVRKSGQGVIPILIDSLRSGRVFQLFGDGSAERDYIAMPDLCDAIERSIQAPLPIQHLTLNIGSGRGVSLRFLIDQLQEMTGRKLNLVHGGAGANVQTNILCCKRAEKYLNWKPRTSFEDGLRALLEVEGMLR